jgi:predicted GIY-YIG superfamily endonuclease
MQYWYVYILESESFPGRYYTGFTRDLKNRLKTHNDAQVTHTSKYCPWKLKNAFLFCDELKARRFERYLKSGSGRAFASRHL